MKKYLKLIPLTLYPYAYLIVIISAFILTSANMENEFTKAIGGGIATVLTFLGNLEPSLVVNAPIALAVGYNLWVLISAILNAVACARGKYTSLEAAKMNMAVKGCQIPAYIFHFLLGAVGFVASIWGVGFLLLAIIVDLLAIITTGINAIGCAVRLCKDGIIKKPLAIILGIGSFIYCADVVIAIVYVVLAKKGIKPVQIMASPPMVSGQVNNEE